MNRVTAIIREALVSALSQPVASVVSIVIVAGMVASVLLTTGRTVGSEQAVLASIDSAGTRSIVVRAEADAGLDSSVLSRLENIEGIHWAGALGPAVDVTNAAIEGGTKVPARLLWTSDPESLGIPGGTTDQIQTAWASDRALSDLGLADVAGGVAGPGGASYAISGRLSTPDYLSFLEPLLVVPHEISPADPEPVSVLVVIAERPDLVAPLSDVVASVLAVSDPTKATLSTSQQLAALRALVEGQLGSSGRALVLLIFGVSAALVASILYGLVMLRRKDFGRRRALGASQALIIALLLLQMTSLAVVGTSLGVAISIATLLASGDPLPGLAFTFAIAVLAVAVAVAAAVIPALAAARREPIAELRVP